MSLTKCSIDKTDRINRAVIGAIILLAGILEFSRFFFIVVGVVLIVEGWLGWCYIPSLIKKFKR